MAEESFRELVNRLADGRRLSGADAYRRLLDPDASPEDVAALHEEARLLARAVFGGKVYARALIEITNRCRNNCLYCGLRRDNHSLHRYSLPTPAVLDCCRRAYEAGFRTFVLQGGEDPDATVASVGDMVAEIHDWFPDAAITLSLGEWSDEAYEAFHEAGATRYLLRRRDPRSPSLLAAPPAGDVACQPSALPRHPEAHRLSDRDRDNGGKPVSDRRPHSGRP